MGQELPLAQRIAAFFGKVLDEAAETPVSPVEPASLSPREVECRKVADSVAKLMARIHDRMGLLQAACQEIGLRPREPLTLHPQLARLVPAVVALMQQQPEAAKLVGSLVSRYMAARVQLDAFQHAIDRGLADSLELEAKKGEFFFLTKIQFYFQPYPLLNQLFNLPQEGHVTEKRATGTAPLGAARAPTASLLPGASPVPAGKTGGTDQLRLGGASERPDDPTRVQGRRLLEKLKVKIMTLRLACDLATGAPAKTEALLPLAPSRLARQMAALIAADGALLARSREVLRRYQQAMTLLAQNPLNYPILEPLLTSLGTLQRAFPGQPLFEAYFASG